MTDDGVYTTTAGRLHASWSASDPETGISEYQYAIGASVGATDVVPWTSTGTSTEVTRTGLALNYTSTYYFTVKAANADDMWSSSGASDGIRPARTVSDIAEAKSYADNECVRVTGRVVAAEFVDSFYIEDPDRIAGIRVTGATASEGTTVTVTGVLATTNGERVLTNAQFE